MKILHFCGTLSRGGGIASFVANIVAEQIKLQHSVTIGIINDQSKEDMVNIPVLASVHEFRKPYLVHSIKYPILIYKYIKTTKPEIVHIHSSFMYYALSILLLHRRVKFVYTIHSDAVKENFSKFDKWFFWLKKICFRLGWMFPVTISKASKQSFDELYGMDSRMIINGIAKPIGITNKGKLTRYRYTKETKIFYHPGRITEAKNQEMLCAAFQHLICNNKDVVLLISGTKQDAMIYSRLEKYFSDRIIYLGERNDVLDLLCEADAMCLSSKWEGMPIVLLEALSVGCIPICTSVGGIAEAITDGENGLMSKTNQLDDYIKTLLRFESMSDIDICKMKAKAKQSFERFCIEDTCREYCEYYDSLLG